MHRIDTLGDIDRHSANSLEPKGILEGLLKIGRSPATLAESNNFRLWEEKVVGTSGRCNRQRMHSHSAFHDLNGAVRKPHQLCGRTIFQFFPDLRGGTTIVAGRSGALLQTSCVSCSVAARQRPCSSRTPKVERNSKQQSTKKALTRANSGEGFTLGASQNKPINLRRTRYGTGS